MAAEQAPPATHKVVIAGSEVAVPFEKDVVIEIDYAIIEHFSQHLYGSPNKAVEELVSNSFDAFATKVFVYIPGKYTNARVIVWDDGLSMNEAELQKLWWIAQSPKASINPERIAQSEDGRTRAMIGKFGIGKLASYAVGHRITHLCKRDKQYLLVAVDYRNVPHLHDSDTGATESDEAQEQGTQGQEQAGRYHTPILQLTEQQARDFVESLFHGSPMAIESLWNESSWTLALIDELKGDIQLTQGRLSWVIGNGMPLRPDFEVRVNDSPVESKLSKGAKVSWDLSEKKVQSALAASWRAAQKEGNVTGDYELVPNLNGSGPAIQFPNLGTVRASISLFEKSLRNVRDDDDPRSYGYFVMVRERLLNPEDAQLGLTDPSFGTFYRSQYVIHADGLDTDLLADRERLHQKTPRTKEFAVIRDALYLASRQEFERLDEERERAGRSESLLPVGSREHFREPFAALYLKGDAVPKDGFNPSEAKIGRAPLNADGPIATLDYEHAQFQVNTNHPLLKAVQRRLGGGKTAREALRALDLFAVAERLFEGYLYDVGLEGDEIDRILSWRDGLLRSMALQYDAAPSDEIISEVRSASFEGDKPFEMALAKLFAAMGFEASRDGVSGKKDVLVIAPIGEESFRFTIEAKGSIHALVNTKAAISGAAAHCVTANAKFSVVVAREFVGFERDLGTRPAALQECDVQKVPVSIATADTLIELFQAMRKYHYPLSVVTDLLSPIESPDEKMARVKGLQYPMDQFDFRGVLDAIWQSQQDEAAGDLVAYRTIWQAGPNRWDSNTLGDFERRLFALESLSGGLMKVMSNQTVALYQHPAVIVEHIQEAVEKPSSQDGADNPTE